MKTIQQAFDEFLIEQRARGNSPRTIDYYRITVGFFISFLGSDFDLSEMTIETYNLYKISLLDRQDIKRVSVKTYLRGVKAFLFWLADMEYISDFTRKIKLIRVNRDIIVPLSDSEIIQLLRSFDVTSRLGLRNLCIVLLMLDCGARRNEVVSLMACDVDFDRSFVIFNGKGNKRRVVPMGVKLQEYMKQYFFCYRTRLDTFFETYTYQPMTTDTINMMFSKLRKTSGITRLHPHLLRHTFATRYILNGGDLETLRLLLGHSDINITQVYLHLVNDYKIMCGDKCISCVDTLDLL